MNFLMNWVHKRTSRLKHLSCFLGCLCLYYPLKHFIKFKFDNEVVVKNLIDKGEKIIFVTYHRHIFPLLGYFFNQTAENRGFKKLVTIISDSDDGNLLKIFLDKYKETIEYVCRPSYKRHGKFVIKRGLTANWMSSKLNEGAVCGVLVIDEKNEKKESIVLMGAAFLAQVTDSFIIPVVAKNKYEFVLKNSWANYRIPLSSGKIFFGNPMKIDQGKGRNWRIRETQKIERELDFLAKSANKKIKGRRFLLPP